MVFEMCLSREKVRRVCLIMSRTRGFLTADLLTTGEAREDQFHRCITLSLMQRFTFICPTIFVSNLVGFCYPPMKVLLLYKQLHNPKTFDGPRLHQALSRT